MKQVNLSKKYRLFASTLAWSVLSVLASGCGRDDAPEANACTPRCAECGAADGCGGTCCDGQVQNADGQWVEPSDCQDTCASASANCGTVCGVTCGKCDGSEQCVAGVCACQPICDGTRCDDGCGGTCACQGGEVCALDGQCVPSAACKDTCASVGAACGEVCGRDCGRCEDGQDCAAGRCVEPRSCPDCALTLSVIEDTRMRRAGDELVLGVDFAPPDGGALPRMAELRLRIDGPATLVDVQSGSALTQAGKALYRDPFTNDAFKQAPDGAYRLLAYGASSASEIGAGRVAEVRLRITGEERVTVSLQRRQQTFAPANADAQLQATSYDLPLLVKP